jgi:hypothetical protein
MEQLAAMDRSTLDAKTWLLCHTTISFHPISPNMTPDALEDAVNTLCNGMNNIHECWRRWIPTVSVEQAGQLAADRGPILCIRFKTKEMTDKVKAIAKEKVTALKMYVALIPINGFHSP